MWRTQLSCKAIRRKLQPSTQHLHFDSRSLMRIILRADSGFARDALMAWCEAHAVDYIFGLARNKRLVDTIAVELAAARQESRHTGRPARQFKDFAWRTRKSWSRKRRVIAKAEWTQGEANPRFIVTSLAEDNGRTAFQTEYCPLTRPRSHRVAIASRGPDPQMYW